MRGGQVDRVEAIAARRPPADMVTAIPGGGAYFALADHLQRADVLVGRRKVGGLLAGLPGVSRFGARDRLAVRPLLVAVKFSNDCFGLGGLGFAARRRLVMARLGLLGHCRRRDDQQRERQPNRPSHPHPHASPLWLTR